MQAISNYYNDEEIATLKENENNLLIVRSVEFVRTLKTLEAQHKNMVAGKSSEGALGTATNTK